jgi:hypothetical protein
MVMKNILGNAPVSWIASIITGVGAIIFSQSISFGWYKKDSLEFSSHTQSSCLFLAGLALMHVGVFVRQILIRLSDLEKELKQLRSTKSQ